MSPEATASPRVLQVEVEVAILFTSAYCNAESPRELIVSSLLKKAPSKGTDISLLLMIEDLASSFPQNLFFSSLKDDLIVICPFKADFDQCCVQSGSWMYAEKLLCLPLSAVF